ncbi:ATP synthase subunit B [Beijerinckia indica]|uniref:ATP synthase subunit b 2 n=1 Tax=Beijerinckia indica subsp. indica (strain ATCC 9039 / DSM 1715 / NCIMB 8712) TaxID=395963 RepID=ATPF2_BEII9|nr:ATP synthase subunit B [Beijerinckia indica]B2IGK9.1 RecName: Full=ATP synthase subunit b 2; AltName: Full=ATP synthase F(0) sector subunit b 2; AltName: Full=ATPase subunit I 2; AltName: Full=F-type ATPase subunit b 2; Short=F-ATPase subunit b 2 [Beijerinckia indica subsp. indica ATCC 9039]ACB94391.1 H+transporting two-sector ATPase B/B' subunit [Beijerinckia indica subsp. indica ATCC 9039]
MAQERAEHESADQHTTSTGVPHEGQGEPFPPFDSSNFAPLLIWLAISFLLLYALMSKLVLPRIGGILHTRNEKLRSDMHEATALHAQAKEAAALQEKTIADAKAKAIALAQENQAKLRAESDAKQHAVEAELAAKLTAAEARITETKAAAMSNVTAIAQEAASAIVQQFTGKAPDAKKLTAALKAKA